jgi:hypothetical protein
MATTAPDPADVGLAARTEPTHSGLFRHRSLESVGPTKNDAQGRTVSDANGVQDRTVSPGKGAQDWTVSSAPQADNGPETEPQTAPERRPFNVRARDERENQGTRESPLAPRGGRSSAEVFVEESYVTDRGRRRARLVRVDIEAVLAELAAPMSRDRHAWLEARALMLDAAGESTFDIWLSCLELVAVDRTASLVVTGPHATVRWVQQRFSRLICSCGHRADRGVRFASEQERLAIENTSQNATSPGGRRQPTNRRVS